MQQQQSRAQSLSASGDDVFANLADQWNVGAQFGGNHLIHGPHVMGNQCEGVDRGGGGLRQDEYRLINFGL
jgi:hypothetical protein